MTDVATPFAALPPLPDGYSARSAVRDDAPALAELLATCELDLTDRSEMTLNDFLGDWEGVDLETSTLVIEGPDGSVAAYGDFADHGHVTFYVYGYVHPTQRDKGLGTHLVAWSERRAVELSAAAPDGARVTTRTYVDEKDPRALQLMAELGYEPVRVTYVMAIDLDGPPPAPEWPAGITVRNFVPGQDEMATHQAQEEAFADMWNRPPGTFDEFLSKLRRPYFDSAHWFLAMDGDQIAGVLLSNNIDGNGWVEIVGVRRPWRGRGLALAMLRHAFAAFHERGVTHIGLSVDAQSPTGAPRVYERAGMHVDRVFRVNEKVLRPGFEPGSGSAAG